MKKLVTFTSAGLWMAVYCMSVAQAQDDGQDPAIIETYSCNFTGNNDLDDVLAVAERWNAWADDREDHGYSATILTPYIFSDQTTFDFGWLGVYPSGEALGAGEGQWLSEGGDIQDDFDAVSECSSHAHYAGLMAHAPSEDGPVPDSDSIGFIAFQDCALADGRIIPEAREALGEWGDYLAEQGDDRFMGLLIPLAGERDDIDFDFKSVAGFNSPQALGSFIDTYVQGGFRVLNDLTDRVMACDSPRVYVTTPVRQASDE